jgi:hypothetical protein
MTRGSEGRFKEVVNELIDEGIYPGPTSINLRYRRTRSNQLNGAETRWRREVMKERNIALGQYDKMGMIDYA